MDKESTSSKDLPGGEESSVEKKVDDGAPAIKKPEGASLGEGKGEVNVPTANKPTEPQPITVDPPGNHGVAGIEPSQKGVAGVEIGEVSSTENSPSDNTDKRPEANETLGSASNGASNPYRGLLCPSSGEPMITTLLFDEEIDVSNRGWWFDGGTSGNGYELSRLLTNHADFLSLLKQVGDGRGKVDLETPLKQAFENNKKRVAKRGDLDRLFFEIADVGHKGESVDEKSKSKLLDRLKRLSIELEQLEKFSLPVVKLDPEYRPAKGFDEDAFVVDCPASHEPMVKVRIYDQVAHVSEAGIWLEFGSLSKILTIEPNIKKDPQTPKEHTFFDSLFGQKQEPTSVPRWDLRSEIDKILERISEAKELANQIEKLDKEIALLGHVNAAAVKREDRKRKEALHHEKLKQLQPQGENITRGWEHRVVNTPGGLSPWQTPTESDYPADQTELPLKHFEGMILCPVTQFPMYKEDVDGKGLVLDISSAGIWLDGGELDELLNYGKRATEKTAFITGEKRLLGRINERIDRVQHRQNELLTWWTRTREIEKLLPHKLCGDDDRLRLHEELGELSKKILAECRKLAAACRLDAPGQSPGDHAGGGAT